MSVEKKTQKKSRKILKVKKDFRSTKKCLTFEKIKENNNNKKKKNCYKSLLVYGHIVE